MNDTAFADFRNQLVSEQEKDLLNGNSSKKNNYCMKRDGEDCQLFGFDGNTLWMT